VLSQIKDRLKEGDIILDGGNLALFEMLRGGRRSLGQWVWIGMGVSRGYQSARRGPSMSPGGSKRAVDEVLPLLEKFAAKGAKGNPYIANIGPIGARHHVKVRYLAEDVQI